MRKVSFGALVALLIATVFWLSPAPSEAAGTNAPWWDTSYAHREELSVRTTDATLNGYSLSITFDHAALVTAGRSLANGDDVRIVRYDGTTNTELDRVLSITNTPTTFNSATTKIWWRAQAAIPANSVDHSYYLYFGKPSAVSPPANANNVYDLFDDFNNPAFDGTVDSSKFNVVLTNTDLTVTQTAGALRISGTTSAGMANVSNGVTGKTTPATGASVEASVRRIVGGNNVSKFSVGFDNGRIAWKAGRSAYFSGGWIYLSGSGVTNPNTFSYQRLSTSILPDGTAKAFENGALRATRNLPAGTTNGLNFLYSPDDLSTSTFEYDDIVVRKLVAIEPVVSVGVADVPTIRVNIEPVLTFSIAGQASACNSAAPVIGTASSTTLNFGRPVIGTNSIVAQSLAAGTNAGVGVTVRISGTTLLAGAADINSVAGTNATPTAFGTGEGFGYTTNAANLPGGTATRFSGVDKWAAVTTTPSPVAFGLPGPTSINACVAFQTGVAATTIAGAYSGTLTYQVVPTY